MSDNFKIIEAGLRADEAAIRDCTNKIKGLIDDANETVNKISDDVWMGKQKTLIVPDFLNQNKQYIGYGENLKTIPDFIDKAIAALDAVDKATAGGIIDNSITSYEAWLAALPATAYKMPESTEEQSLFSDIDYSKYVSDSRTYINSEEDLRNLEPGRHKVWMKSSKGWVKTEVLIPPVTKGKGLIYMLPGGGNGGIASLITSGKIPMPDKVVISPYYWENGYNRFNTDYFYNDTLPFIVNAFGLDNNNKTLMGLSVGAQNIQRTLEEGHVDEWNGGIYLFGAGIQTREELNNGMGKTSPIVNDNNNANVHVVIGSDEYYSDGPAQSAATRLGVQIEIVDGANHANIIEKYLQ